jgi:hypothetical protein
VAQERSGAEEAEKSGWNEMKAKVTIEYTVKNVCNREDYGKNCRDKTFADLVRSLIKDEGIFGIAEDKYKIVSIRHAK